MQGNGLQWRSCAQRGGNTGFSAGLLTSFTAQQVAGVHGGGHGLHCVALRFSKDFLKCSNCARYAFLEAEDCVAASVRVSVQ